MQELTRQLTRQQARRIAVHAQLLGAPRPQDLHEVVDTLTIVQHDATAAVAPSAELVLWSRLGPAFERADLAEALQDRSLIELAGMIRPAQDIALFAAEMAAWPGQGTVEAWRDAQAEWVEVNDSFRVDVLGRLEDEGPLTSRELPDTCEVPWRSSGWNNNRNVAMMLETLAQRGDVAVAGRRGRDRLWDLAERVYPDVPALPVDEARRVRAERRLRSLGLARAKGAVVPGEPVDVGEVGDLAVIEGVKGQWRVDPQVLADVLDTPPAAGRTAVLSPLDRLLFDRVRMAEIFEFDYQLEMYKPAAKRRFGYFALPVLHGDRLVGKVDATTDRVAGVLRVDAVHEDTPFDPDLRAAVQDELRDLARCLGVQLAVAGGRHG